MKQQTAQAILAREPRLVISAQVLNEFYTVVTRKLAKPLPAPEAEDMVIRLAELPCVPIDVNLVRDAIMAGQRWQLSHWDALVVEAARQAGCIRVLTEDLANGANYQGVRIENPFDQ